MLRRIRPEGVIEQTVAGVLAAVLVAGGTVVGSRLLTKDNNAAQTVAPPQVSTTTSTMQSTTTTTRVPPSQIVSSERIGSYAVESDGSSQGAEKAFGQPNRRTRTANECTISWESLGLDIAFYNLGGLDPCANGRFCSARIHGTSWATNNGLQVGEPVRRLWELYGQNEIPASGATRRWLLEPGTAPCGRDSRGGLEAESAGASVIAFRVTYLAGGD